MKTSQVTEKGQILIPVAIRKKYGLKSGSKVMVTDEGRAIRVTPVTVENIRKLAGILTGKNLSTALLDSRKKEKSVNR